jgi:predicted thioesterase
MMDGLKPGMRGEASLVVGTNDTAPRIGSGRVPVLGTPVMITLMEEAALACVEHALPPGHQSLGTHLDVSHIAATPIGMRITAEAELIDVDGRKLVFAVRARDEVEPIGEGRHARVVVEVARFEGRLLRKSHER